ncbi:MAG: hypothetical protein KatS3mg124_1741 [Porticoccaceae bacterium]|nr:MAG: hypothetical protein KatS3mg124_1741 [Porticoccaceae bacterium]
MRRVLAAAILGAAAAATAGGADEVSFARDLEPLLVRRCGACHITGEEPGRMALVPGKAWDALVGVPSVESSLLRVAPGRPEESYLIHKLRGTHLEVGGSGVRMPFHQPPLPAEQIERFARWIAAGAPRN